MLWNTRRIWLLLWLMIAMAMAGARPALAQITEQVQMSDSQNQFEFYDQVNGGACPTATQCANDTTGTVCIKNNNDPTDPNFVRNQMCATSVIRVGDKVSWLSPPPSGVIGAGPHGTASGGCIGLNCSPTGSWTDGAGQNAGDPPFIVPPGSNAGFSFNANGVLRYFCTVHLSVMTGTVAVQDYSLAISPAEQWVYAASPGTPVNFTGTATGLPNGANSTLANGASAAYNSLVTLGNTGSGNETVDGTVTPSAGGTSFNIGDSGESFVGDPTISVSGFGGDASHLKENSNTATLHVVQLTLAAVLPPSQTIAPTDAVGKQYTIQVTANGTFPASVVPTCSGMPAGATCSFSPNPITPGVSAQTITMTVTTNGVASGTYHPSFTIAPGSGNSSGLAQKSSGFTMVVSAFNAVLSSPSSQIIPPGGAATFNGTLTSVGGYSGNIVFTCQPAAPAGAACPGAGSTTPVALSAGGSSPFTVKFVDTTFLGTDSFNIVATGPGPVVDNIPVTVNVGGFTLGNPSIPPPAAISDTIGNPSQTMTFQIIPTGAFNTSVTLSCIGGAAPSFPAGASCKFYPSNVITLSGSAVTVTLVVTTTSATTANTYNFNVQGVGGGSTQTISGGLKLNVTAGAASIDLSVVASGKVLSPGPVQLVGAPLIFNFSITNTNGTATATTATALISFSVPVSSPQFGGTSGACTGSGSGPYTCPVASIAANGSRTVSATIKAPFVRSMTATTQVSSPETDTNQANNVASSTAAPIRLRPFARKGLPAKLP